MYKSWKSSGSWGRKNIIELSIDTGVDEKIYKGQFGLQFSQSFTYRLRTFFYL